MDAVLDVAAAGCVEPQDSSLSFQPSAPALELETEFEAEKLDAGFRAAFADAMGATGSSKSSISASISQLLEEGGSSDSDSARYQ